MDRGQLRIAVIIFSSVGQHHQAGIKADVKNNLARYKVPRDVVFLDELPCNATVTLLPTQLADIEIDT
jgi:acyl-CoA synthetase (AMP-forming)/AMP-acid ligase II